MLISSQLRNKIQSINQSLSLFLSDITVMADRASKTVYISISHCSSLARSPVVC